MSVTTMKRQLVDSQRRRPRNQTASYLVHAVAVCAAMSIASGCEPGPENGGIKSDSIVDEGDEVFEDEVTFRGATTFNGLSIGNGLLFSNGLQLSNGLSLKRGLADQGLNLSYGLATENGLSSQFGYTQMPEGRTLIKYMVECALPQGDSVVKAGTTYNGMIGLAPQWKNGGCDKGCQEWVSACLLARTNEFGAHVNIDMRAEHESIGIDPGNPEFNQQEGAFFGNLFSNPPVSHACMGNSPINSIFELRTCATNPMCSTHLLEWLLCGLHCDSVNGTFVNCRTSTGYLWWKKTTYHDAVVTTYLKPFYD